MVFLVCDLCVYCVIFARDKAKKDCECFCERERVLDILYTVHTSPRLSWHLSPVSASSCRTVSLDHKPCSNDCVGSRLRAGKSALLHASSYREKKEIVFCFVTEKTGCTYF